MRKFGMMAMVALMMMACQDRNAYTISGTYEAAGEGDSVSLQLVEGALAGAEGSAFAPSGALIIKL